MASERSSPGVDSSSRNPPKSRYDGDGVCASDQRRHRNDRRDPKRSQDTDSVSSLVVEDAPASTGVDCRSFFESVLPPDCRLRAVSYLRPSELYGRYALASRQCLKDSESEFLPQAEWGELFCGPSGGGQEVPGGAKPGSRVDDVLRRWAHPSHRRAFHPSGRRRRLKIMGHWTLERPDTSYEDLIAFARAAALPGVAILDASIPSHLDEARRTVPRALFWALSAMLPSLREIDLSNLYSGPVGEETLISELACFRGDATPHLEVVRWNGRVGGCHFLARGNDLKTLPNLREIHLDNITADCRYDGSFEVATYSLLMECSDYGAGPDRHILMRCCSNLERLSLAGAMYYNLKQGRQELRPLPQQSLIKFVRAVPTLRWFRCSLSEKNVRKLQKERPEIDFVIG